MIARFVSDVMSQERFKQEAALVVLDRVMEAAATNVLNIFQSADTASLQKLLDGLEETKAKQLARISESIADAVTGALGPVYIPEAS